MGPRAGFKILSIQHVAKIRHNPHQRARHAYWRSWHLALGRANLRPIGVRKHPYPARGGLWMTRWTVPRVVSMSSGVMW